MASTLVRCAVFALALAGRATAEARPVVSVHGLRGESHSASTELVAKELAGRLAHVAAPCHLDATITRIAVEPSPHGTAVAVTVRVAVSDARGMLVSLIDGTARAEGRTHRAQLESDALTAAIAGMTTKIDSTLRGQTVAAR
jgi:hypothetical protein